MGYLDETTNNLEGMPADLSGKRDEELLAASVSNPAMFEALVDRYQAAFLRNTRKVLGTREEAIDVVQETFTKIYMNAGRFHEVEGAKFSSWAYKILFNTSFTYYQKTKKKENFFARVDEEVWNILPDMSADTLERMSMRDEVAKAIANIPEPLARILTLYYIEDKPQKEIADLEGISLPAVKTRIHRAKKAFRNININMAI